MKRSWLVVIALLLGTLAAGVSRAGNGIAILWEAALGGEYADFAYDVVPTSDGGYLAVGAGTNVNNEGVYVVKSNAVGLPEWEQLFDLNAYSERAFSAQEMQDGNFLVVGRAYLPDTYEFRPWLLKIDPAGNLLWSTENGLTQQIDVDAAIVRGLERPDGSIVIAGGTNTFTNFQELWVATVSSTGALQSFTTYPPLLPGYGQGTYVEALVPTADGGFVLSGSESLPGQAFLWKFDANAQEEWSRLYSTEGLRSAFDVAPAADGGYLLSGCTSANCTDAMLVKTDAQGNALWSNTYPVDDFYGEGTSVIAGSDGTIIMSRVRGDAVNALDTLVDILEIDPAGNLLNAVTLPGGQTGTTVQELLPTDAGSGFIGVGYARVQNVSALDFYLVKGLFGDAVTNLPPIGEPDSYTTSEDQPITVAAPGVLANDTDPEGDLLAAWLISGPLTGTLTLEPDGGFIYTPTIGFTGVDEFVYRAFDGQATSLNTTVLITVTEALNHPPEAVDDWYEIGYNRVLTVTAPGVLANDIDADGDELDANPLTPPQHGMTVFYPDGAFIYTPLDGFSGTDSFTYRVHDGFSWSDPATITIEVGPPAGYTYDWVAAFGGDSFDYANDVTPTSDGGFAAVGVTAEGNYESVYVVKADGNGNRLWENQFSLGNYAERGFDIEETQDGGLIVFATAYIPNTSNFRPWLLKLDADGNRLWSTEDGLTQELDVKSGIIHGLERPDGGFVIAGGSNSLTSFQEAWVATVSITGTLESFTTYPPFRPGFGQGTFLETIAPTADGGFILAGSEGSGLGEGLLWKFDADAQQEWAQLLGPAGLRVAQNVVPAADGGYLLTGCDLPNCNNTVLLKTDPAGNTTWVQTYANPDGDYTRGWDVLEHTNGGFLLLQTRATAVNGHPESELLEINADGSLRTANPVPGGMVQTALHRLLPLPNDGGFILAGSKSDSGGSAGLDLYLVQGAFDPHGNLPPTALPDAYQVDGGEALVIPAGAGVLVNDSDADGDPLEARLVQDVAHGTLEMAANGSFVYTPAAGFSGTDHFTYRASDGMLLSVLVTVHITVEGGAPPEEYLVFIPILQAND